MPVPDNGFYYHAAYVIVAVVYCAYALSLGMRRRALLRRLANAGDRSSTP